MPLIRNLILILGDQLTPALTSLAAGDPARDLVLMAELQEEATYFPITRRISPSSSRPCGILRGSCGRRGGGLGM
jgi:hypothetical protein